MRSHCKIKSYALQEQSLAHLLPERAAIRDVYKVPDQARVVMVQESVGFKAYGHP